MSRSPTPITHPELAMIGYSFVRKDNVSFRVVLARERSPHIWKHILALKEQKTHYAIIDGRVTEVLHIS